MTDVTRQLAGITALVALTACAMMQGSGVAFADNADEQQMGAQLYSQLKSQDEIVKSSPLYDTLAPIAAGITKAVQPKYPYPIHFYIVHEAQPNAFAAPGGNIYVVDSLFYFVHNTEELAGTICHETSHLLHHDSVELMKQQEAIRERAIAATVLLGPSIKTALTVSAIAQLDSNHRSRGAEEQADLTGAATCAAAGYNPWGLVWLMQDFENSNLPQPPEILSDHPDDQHRVDALEKLFQSNPATYAHFNSNRSSAKPLDPPANEAENFVR
ncbi:MAG TPA: M48 family metalloprotease [Candidatus Binatus sp.]|nr:M48 family metalloprotease [Candidatus Binatus sp.]